MAPITSAPTPTPMRIQEYGNILLNWCGYDMPPELGVVHRGYDRLVRKATRMKAKHIPQREYVVIEASESRPHRIEFEASCIQRATTTKACYTLDDLYVREAIHMKAKTPIGHEFIVTVANYNNSAQQFMIRLERVLQAPCSVSDLPPGAEARARFEASLSDDQRKQLAEFLRPKFAWLRNVFRRADTTATPIARSLEVSTSPSERHL